MLFLDLEVAFFFFRFSLSSVLLYNGGGAYTYIVRVMETRPGPKCENKEKKNC